MPTQIHPKYRPDIDGLRAIAVLSVVGFHAFPKWVAGGFIGVDIFFVISGYLISTILFENLDKGIFSFAEFYSRRVIRIFPALIVVLISCYSFGWMALFAEEFKQLGKHIVGGASFLSNIVLLSESGYFDNAAHTKPLLHLWSLGVEEQFYIIWPFLLWISWRCRFNLGLMTLLVMLISFYLNVRAIDNDSVKAFFSPQTRFWELLSGGLLAWIVLYNKNIVIEKNIKISYGSILDKKFIKFASAHSLNIISIVGLALLCYGIATINEESKFPGFWALIPVAGSMLIIFSGAHAWANRVILSNKILVFIGLISFPLYLWHWPILSFAHIIEGGVPDLKIRKVAVILSFILAWLTYRFVEKPFRFGIKSKSKVVISLFLMLILGCVGGITYIADGFTFRSNSSLKGYQGDVGHLEYHKFIAENYFICTPEEIANNALKWGSFVRCMQSKPGNHINIALIGDSHAEHLFLGMAEALPMKNIVFYIQGSPPFISNPEFKDIFSSVLANKDINTVLLTMHWYGRVALLHQIPIGSNLERELIGTIDALSASGKKVLLVDDVPRFPFGAENCKDIRWLASTKRQCEMDLVEFNKQKETYMSSLNSVVQKRPEVKILEVAKYLCNDKACYMTRNNEILYRDDGHLNIKASLYVGRRLVEDNPGFLTK